MGTTPSKDEAGGGGSAATPAYANSVNEIQVLQGHSDIVRCLIRCGRTRICSGGDDGRAILWNFHSGEQLHVFEGHILPITCMLCLSASLEPVGEEEEQPEVLVTGSSDRTVRIWSLVTRKCVAVLKEHEGAITCMRSLPAFPAGFCSAGNDRQIVLWDAAEAKCIGRIERNEEENLHCMIATRDDRLITGSNSALMYVYNSKEGSFERCLSFHRESVRCLVNLDVDTFASASLDGAIVIWNAADLTAVKTLCFPDQFVDSKKMFFCSVRKLVPLPRNCLAAAIGSGFKIFRVDTGECIMENGEAHDSDVTGLLPLYGATRLVSCSSDNSVRIWAPRESSGLPPVFRSTKSKSTSSAGTPNRRQKGRSILHKGKGKVAHVCAGKMWVHAEAVLELLELTPYSFATCGADGQVVIWKDGRVQSEMRNNYACASLLANDPKVVIPPLPKKVAAKKKEEVKQKKAMRTLAQAGDALVRPRAGSAEGEPSAFSISQATGVKDASQEVAVKTRPRRTTLSGHEVELGLPRGQGRPFTARKPASTLLTSAATDSSLYVPEYLIDHASTLLNEGKMSAAQVRKLMLSLGHNAELVDALMQRVTRIGKA